MLLNASDPQNLNEVERQLLVYHFDIRICYRKSSINIHKKQECISATLIFEIVDTVSNIDVRKLPVSPALEADLAPTLSGRELIILCSMKRVIFI